MQRPYPHGETTPPQPYLRPPASTGEPFRPHPPQPRHPPRSPHSRGAESFKRSAAPPPSRPRDRPRPRRPPPRPRDRRRAPHSAARWAAGAGGSASGGGGGEDGRLPFRTRRFPSGGRKDGREERGPLSVLLQRSPDRDAFGGAGLRRSCGVTTWPRSSAGGENRGRAEQKHRMGWVERDPEEHRVPAPSQRVSVYELYERLHSAVLA